jgi:Ice-binding-like
MNKNLIFVMFSVAIIVLSMLFVSAAQSAVNLGTAGNFVILTKTGISTTGTTAVTGDIGVSPIDSTAITGFDLIGVVTTDTFLTSALVTGKIYAADLVSPTPTKMTTAVSDMETAYTDAAGRTLPDYTELYSGDLSGKTLTPGLYKWGTGVLINSGVTLSGGANEIWIFQIAQDLTIGNGAIITLSGGAQAKNIFWQVAGQTTLGTTSQFKGIILCQTLIEINTGATLSGRALAQTAVTLDANVIKSPGTASSSPPATNPPSGGSGSGSGGSHSGTTTPPNTSGTADTATPAPSDSTSPDTSGTADTATPATSETGILKSPLGKKILIGIAILAVLVAGYFLLRKK